MAGTKLTDVFLHGTHAGRPAAAAANTGYYYFEDDTATLFQSDGSTWNQRAISDTASNLTYLDATVAAAPATPASGKLRIYAKTGKALAVKDDAGVETVLGAGGPGGASVGVVRRLNSTGAPGGTNDDEFTGTSIAVAWTRVQDGTSPYSWTEKYDRLNAFKATGGTSSHLDCQLKTITPTIGDYIETAIAPGTLSFDGLGLIFADGSTYGAGTQVVVWAFRGSSQGNSLAIRTNAWTNFNASGASGTEFDTTDLFSGELYLRLKYEAANTFGLYVSLDGVNWNTVQNNYALTLTPTRVGLALVNWTPTAAPQWNGFHYFRYNPA